MPNVQEIAKILQDIVLTEVGTISLFAVPFSTIEKLPQKRDWARQYARMAPHFYGFMSDAIKKAFPNESAAQLEYRCHVYASPTKEHLNQAIKDVNRIVMGERFLVQLGKDTITEAAKRLEYVGSNLLGYFMNDVYPQRVLDPNAMLCVIPDEESIKENKDAPIELKLWVFNSSDIIYTCDDLLIVVDRNKGENYFQIFTLNIWASIKATDASWEIVAWYEHDNDDLGASVLGGTKVPQTYNGTVFQTYKNGFKAFYYESDFGFAIPSMNNLEILDSQKKCITNTTTFPVMVTSGLECEDCSGKGVVHKRDAETGQLCYKDLSDNHNVEENGVKYHFQEPVMDNCKKCGGKGTISISALDGINVPKEKSLIPGQETKAIDLKNSVIAWAAPDVSNVVEVRTQFENQEARLETILNITRPSKFTESGVSKEKDRESKYTILEHISSDLERLIKDTCISIVKYLFYGDTEQTKAELKAIVVKRPVSFDIESLSELEAELKDISQKSIPLRYILYKRVYEKKFGSNSNSLKVLNLAYDYTMGNNLRTPEELSNWVLTGRISKEAASNYENAEAVISLLFEKAKYEVENMDTFFGEVKAKLAQLFKEQSPKVLPPATI